MSTYTSPDAAHVDRLMTSFSIANIQSDSNFGAGRLFPGIGVQKRSDRYTRYPKGSWYRAEMAKRAGGTKAKSANFEVDTTPTYYCEGWSLSKPIIDEERSNVDAPMDPDRDATLFLTHQAKIRREKNFIASYWKTGVWGRDYQGVSGSPGVNQFKQFNDATSTPIKFMRQCRTEMARRNGGFRPNKLGLGREVFDALMDHPDIVARVLYGGRNGAPAKTSLEILAELFELDEVVILDGVENTSIEGAADNMQFIGGKSMLLVYSPETPSLLMPCAGITFAWTGFLPGQGRNMGEVISRFRVNDGSRAEILQVDAYYDLKIVSEDCGFYFYDVVA